MLIRFLEAGLYEDARDIYDLNCCIECGLCSYVCTSRIPIFQYIKVAKTELDLKEAAEAENE
jgi:electron transport complex protein RnfC